MSKYQLYSPYDPLREYKMDKSNLYYNCDFYENFQNGCVTTLRSGFIDGAPVLETVITDGHISIEGPSRDKCFVVIRNVLYGLDNSRGVEVSINDASFMVSSLLVDGKRTIDIHVETGSKPLYDSILNYLFNGGHLEVERISFRNQTMIEFSFQGSTELFDLKTGKTKTERTKRKSR